MRPSKRLCGMVVVLLAPWAAFAQEANDESLRAAWQETYRKIAASIEMRRGQTPLTLEANPLLFYTNPVRTNGQHGAIFLWTEAGRPAVLGSIWSAINRNDATVRFVTHEWHSLVEDPEATAARNGQTLWTAGEAGIAWQPLADVPPPSRTRSARLVQMRNIARRFTVDIQAEGESGLRLMSQPLYRYPEKTSSAVDGAIFAYAMVTDPELLVLVEAREEETASGWRVAFARFGNLAMTVHDGDRLVWSCQRGFPGRSEGRYYLKWRAEEMPAEPKAAQETGAQEETDNVGHSLRE